MVPLLIYQRVIIIVLIHAYASETITVKMEDELAKVGERSKSRVD